MVWVPSGLIVASSVALMVVCDLGFWACSFRLRFEFWDVRAGAANGGVYRGFSLLGVEEGGLGTVR